MKITKNNMEKGYYKNPDTKEINKGSFEDAWKSFINKIEKEVEDEENPIKNKIKEIVKDKFK